MGVKCKVLITGGSGFIGSNLVERFLLCGHDVINFDMVEPQRKEFLKYWINVDINRFEILKQNIIDYSPDYIVHLAARTDLNGVNLDDYKTNILGVENMLIIANQLYSLKKIVFTSSMLVCYGGYKPKHQFDYAPTTVYGESKVVSEKIVWANKPNCDWAIIRPTSIWGPWFSVPYKSFFDMILARRYFHIGDKACVKTYGFIGNAVCQIDKILFSNTLDESKKIFYLGDDPAINIEEWANEIAGELGYKLFRMPFMIVKLLAFFGDILKLINVDFPMNSFRLGNMTTDNIIDLKNTNELISNLPYNRIDGIKITLKWIIEHRMK